MVFDPVLSSGSGYSFSNNNLCDALIELLIPHTTVFTPNSLEARELAPGADNLDAAAQQLLEYGCQFVLLTGSHENTVTVINTLYGNKRPIRSFEWERLPYTYHGSGCTLASAIAAMLARGDNIINAVEKAQDYTWQALKHGYRPGMGQHLPNRLFWTPGGGYT